MQPFELGSRTTAERLAMACRDAGHEVELVYLPWPGRHPVRQLAAYRWIDLASSSDVVICLDLPAIVIRHPRKVVWMTRPAGCVASQIDDGSRPNVAAGRASDAVDEIRQGALAEAVAIHVADECAVAQSPHPAATRLLRLPPEQSHGHQSLPYDGDFVCVGPFTASSRLETVIDAVAVGRSRVRVGLLGDFDDPGYERVIRERVRTKNIGNVVSFEPAGCRSAKSLARSAAVIQLGACCDDLFVAAARRAKAVLVSPEVLAEARGASGMVHPVDVSADGLAQWLDLLATDQTQARRLGLTAAEALNANLPTWGAVASQLLP